MEKSAYVDNRAILFDRTYRQQLQLEVATSRLDFNQEMLMPIYNEWGETIDYHPINDDFLQGHHKVVQSLRRDLEQAGESGLALEITMDIEKEYTI